MNRRRFISRSAGAFLIPSIAGLSCNPKDKPNQSQTSDTSGDIDIENNDISGLSDLMKSQKITSRQLVQHYLDRINKIDKDGPKINSVIELNPDALSIADQLDKELASGQNRGPLHGIPVLIKDNIDTADKMMTTAGSLALEGNIATADAFIVQKLRSAGAVILGKTNLSEWANFRSERSSSGWSSRGGQTKNPYVLDRNPCGSSSGSGAAVAAGLCAFAIGTETNGSIGCPSSINGIVGIKPTVGLWSRSGIIPISKTQDTAGPMTRTVKDAAIVLGALIGEDSNDEATRTAQGKALADYTSFLKTDGLRGKKIGVEKSFRHGHEGVDALFDEAIRRMEAQGAEIVEVDFMSLLKDIGGDEYLLLQYEFKDGLNSYLSKAKAKVKSLHDVIVFDSVNAARVMPFFRQEILVKSDALGGLDEKKYKDAVEKATRVARRAIEDTLKQHGLDALCGPTNGPSWCTDLINGDAFNGYGMYSPAAIAGYPHVSVPMGFVNELPVGLTFLARAFEEPKLVEISFGYEQASKKRKAPRFLEKVGGSSTI